MFSVLECGTGGFRFVLFCRVVGLICSVVAYKEIVLVVWGV
jgi:hypothetical protein